MQGHGLAGRGGRATPLPVRLFRRRAPMRKVDPVKHEKKRQDILEAAGRCFVRDGFRGASTSDICAEAKISPGHLYHYFASKEAIMAAMAEANLDQAAPRLRLMVQKPAA